MKKAILTINAGSSSIKFSLFYVEENKLDLFYSGSIDIKKDHSVLKVIDANNEKIKEDTISNTDYSFLFQQLITFVNDTTEIIAVGHRVVHGGLYFKEPVLVDEVIIDQIQSLITLAPLHQPHNLNAIRIIAEKYPLIPQCVCFDTSYHMSQSSLAKLFALPRKLINDGVIRYGFHGLSYEYISSVLNSQLGEVGNQKVIALHLGSGASICAINHGKSVASSMGFTALDGLVMGTRCGTLDPGVIPYLMGEKGYSISEVVHLLYHDSGLLGVSNNISNDMRQLLVSNDPNAIEAVELFCYRAACEIGQLSISLGGCDALVFTAGIGERSPIIRQKICDYLQFWGIKLNSEKNNANNKIISDESSSKIVSVIPTNEELMIALHTKALCCKN